jgi:rod shape-determining protein MreC
LLIIVLSAVTLITLDTRNGRTGPLGALGRAAHAVVSPVEGAVSNVADPISDWWHGVTDAGDLRRDNRELRQRLAEAEGRARAGEQAVKENEVLHETLNLPLLSHVERVTGRIISRDPGNFDPTFKISKGQEAGIAVDMPVISPAGLVGKVIETGRGYSKVQVLTDPEFAVGVQTPAHEGSQATTGVARGQVGSHDLRVEFDAGTRVDVGDMIVTSPLSSLFPADIPVGEVTRVREKAGGIGITATIRPYVDLGALDFLTVILWVQGEGAVVSTTTTSTTTTTVPGLFPTTTTVPGQ